MIEVHGERFEEGDRYVQVTSEPIGKMKTNFLIERARDLRDIRMRCELTGTYDPGSSLRLRAARLSAGDGDGTQAL